jgi:hypothetical protein
MTAIKVLTNSASLTAANNMGLTTMVRVVNTSNTVQTVTVANTVSKVNGGGIPGTIVLAAGTSEILVKQPTDTVISVADVKATGVARY